MQEYLGKLSGPLLDRFDIRISVPAVKLEEMIAPQSGEDSATVAARVLTARKIQWARNEGVLNAHLDGERLYELSKPEPAGQKLLESTVEKKGPTARGFNRILRVTRTLADLAGVDTAKNPCRLGFNLARARGFHRPVA